MQTLNNSTAAAGPCMHLLLQQHPQNTSTLGMSSLLSLQLLQQLP